MAEDVLVVGSCEFNSDKTEFVRPFDKFVVTRGIPARFAPVTTATYYVLTSNIVGSWQGDNGMTYEFTSDAVFKAFTPSGEEVEGEYRYLLRNFSSLVIFGPLVDGEEAALQEYKISGNYKFSKKEKYFTLNLGGESVTLRR
jgi:hypothetical protein